MSSEEPIYRYRDFPELFWDVQPDAVIDRTNPRMIARVLTDGSMDAIRKLVPMEILLRDFEKLLLPDHPRRFWSLVAEMRRARQAKEQAARGHAA